MNFYSEGLLFSKFSTILPGKEVERYEYRNISINDIQINRNQVIIETSSMNFSLSIYEDSVLMKGDNNILPINMINSKLYVYNEPEIDLFIIRQRNVSEVITLKINYISVSFLFIDDSLKLINARNELVDIIDDVDACCFIGFENFATNRGYIWSRTIPILKNTLLFEMVQIP